MSNPSPSKPKRKPLLSRVPADFVRAVLKGHSSLGLAFAAIIYLVCLTGSIAVFAREFERWELARIPHVEAASPAAVQTALENIVGRADGEIEHAYIQLPRPDLPYLNVTLQNADGETHWIADADGRLVAQGGTPWTEFLTRLHINLHLPRIWGLFLVGLTGVALLSSLISGLLAHPRIFRDAFHLRLGGSRRLQEADLHNRLGVWAMPFHFLVSLSGALLGLTTLIVGVLGFALFQGDVNKVYALFLPAEPVEDARPAPVINLVPMLQQLERIAPGGRPDLILLEHPTEMGGAAMILVEQDNGRLSSSSTFAFNRAGQLYYSHRAEENNLGESILSSLGKLHFGWFGGGIVKVAYGLLGLALTYLAASGVYIWLARRRDKRNAAPVWERVWSGVVWGQPVALALAALAAIVGGTSIDVGILIAIWGTVTLIAVIAARWVGADRLALSLRRGTAIALAGCAIMHIVLRPGTDAVAWTVDITLLAIAALLIWFDWQRARRAEAVT